MNEIYGCEVEHKGGRGRLGGLVDVESPKEFNKKLLEQDWDRMETEDTGMQAPTVQGLLSEV